MTVEQDDRPTATYEWRATPQRGRGLQEYAGRYTSPELDDAVVTVSTADSGLTVEHYKTGVRRRQPTFADTFECPQECPVYPDVRMEALMDSVSPPSERAGSALFG
jgi:hypothetical protein